MPRRPRPPDVLARHAAPRRQMSMSARRRRACRRLSVTVQLPVLTRGRTSAAPSRRIAATATSPPRDARHFSLSFLSIAAGFAFVID
jgi:hypothetical protein